MSDRQPNRRRSVTFFALLLSLVATGCLSGSLDKRTAQIVNQMGFGGRTQGDAEYENYLKLGDRLSYSDRYNPDLAGAAVVDIDGTIILPEVGAVYVLGLTRTEVEALLTQKFSPYYARNDVRVTLTTSGRRYFFMVGEVQGPNRVPFEGDLTIFEAIMQANVMEETANLGRVRVIRADPRAPLVFPVNVSHMIRTGDSSENILIRERDIIVIPPTMLAQIGYFITDLISPITIVLQKSLGSLLQLNRQLQLSTRGFGGPNNNNNQGFSFF